MPLRPLSDRQREWLSAELTAWQQSDIVTAEQAQRVLAEYESVESSRQQHSSRGVMALQSIAALFACLAVLLVVGYNWQELAWWLKVAMSFTMVLSAHATAAYLRFRTPRIRLANTLCFAACILYGVAIWLIAQVFHLDAHYPDGVFWWAVGVIPIAWAFDSVLLHLLVASLVALWTGMEIINFSHLGPWWWRNMPNGAYAAAVLIAPGMWWSYRARSLVALSAYVAIIAWWCTLQGLAWDFRQQMVFVVAALGPLLFMLAELHSVGSRLAIPYRFWGTLLTGGALIPLSFGEFYRSMFNWWGRRAAPFDLLPLFVFAIVSAVVICGLDWGRLGRDQVSAWSPQRLQQVLRRQWEPLAALVLVLIAAVFAALNLSEARESGAYSADTPWGAVIAINLTMIGMALWLIQVGVREQRGLTFSAGVGYLLLWGWLRYVDLFAEAGGMLGAAGLFFLMAVTLVVVARWWGRQREVRHVEHA